MQPWQRTDEEESLDFHIFKIRRHTAVSPRTGAEGRYVTIEAPDWVNVIAVTAQQEVVLVRQYRHGVAAITLEIPSGMVEQGEEPLEAARRELAEETGYVSEQWRFLGVVHPNPAYQDNHCFSYLATDCRFTTEQELDAGEDIEVLTLPFSDVGQRIAQGEIDHALIVTAFFRYLQAGQPCGPLFTS